jgi:hypothetical protein
MHEARVARKEDLAVDDVYEESLRPKSSRNMRRPIKAT